MNNPIFLKECTSVILTIVLDVYEEQNIIIKQGCPRYIKLKSFISYL